MEIFLTTLRRVFLLTLTVFGVFVFFTLTSDWYALAVSDADHRDPVLSRDVLSYDIHTDGTVSYDYRAEELPPLLHASEVPALRTESSFTKRIFTNVKGDDIYELIAYTDRAFVQDNGKWFAREKAHTDRATFAARRQSDLLESFFWENAYADAIAPFAGSGDGVVHSVGGAVWATEHDQATGGFVSTSGASITARSFFSDPAYGINRSFFPFDTSAIPLGATVSVATLNLWVTGVTNTENDGNDFVTVVQSSQATHTALADTDYDALGSTEGISTGNRIDLGSLSAGAYNTLTFNATGISWIKGEGDGSNCSVSTGITCLGVREGHDVLNDAPSANNNATFSTSEETGTSQDPYLSVTYSLSADTIVVLTSGTSWTVPSDWDNDNNTVEVIGGGAGGVTGSNGDGSNGNTGGRGGGGGAYASESSISLPGGSIVIQVGAAGGVGGNGTDTFFNRTVGSANTCSDTTSVCADGATAQTGGQTSASTGTVKNNGGNGGNLGTFTSGHDTGSGGGGGGGTGGSGSAGTAGTGGSASVGADTPGGNGGAGGAGGTPSGGAGGAFGAGGTNGPANAGNGSPGMPGQIGEIGRSGGGGGGGGGGARDSGSGGGGEGGAAGQYGAGGGGGGGGGRGDSSTGGTATAGSQGMIVVTYTPSADTMSSLSKPPNNLGLVGYWSFNEATSTTATDFSGNGNHGTLQNFSDPQTPTSGWVNGKRGSAIAFAGLSSDDSVNAGDINATDGVLALTLSMWIYDRNTAAGRGIVSKYAGATPGWDFYTSDAGDCGGDDITFSPDGNDGECTSGNVHQANRWEHWVAVYSGGQADDDDDVKLYLNGVLQTDVRQAGNDPVPDTTNSTGNSVRIGADSDLGAEFEGIIDEVRIYNRALGATEAASLFGAGGGAVRAGSSSKKIQQGTTLGKSLVGHWTFDGGDVRWTSETTGVAYDGSGNNNIGTLTTMSRASTPAIGKLGQALDFDGTSDYVSIADSASFDLSTGSNYSWSAWVKTDNLTTDVWHTIWGQVTGSVNDLVIYAHTTTDAELPGGSVTNGISAWWFQNSSNKIITEAESAISANTWFHLAVTYDGSLVAASRFKIYVDGLDVTDSSSTAGTVSAISPDAIRIGAYNASTDFLDGKIDDVRFYTKTLTTAEVKQLYQLGQVRIRQ